MGFEIPIDVDYFEHPKTLHLISILKREEADVYPLRLWKYCAKYARGGVIEGGARVIESVLKWSGKRGKLHSALISAGFLEVDGKTVHDWMDGVGRAILIYDEKKRKQREKYAQTSGILPEEKRQYSPYPNKQQQETQETPETREGLPEETCASEADRLLIDKTATKPNYKAGLLLLLSLDVRKERAGDLALAYPWGRIAEVVRAAKGQENPGGWAIKALEERWAIPNPFTEADLLHLAKNGNGQEAAK